MTQHPTNLATAESTDPDAASGDYWARTRTAIATRWIDAHDPETLLDVGCGSGYLTAQLASAGRTAVGVDPDTTAIDRAQRRDTQARFEPVPAGEAPPGPFDAVLSMDVIEHVPPADIWQALADRLDDDGRLIVSVPAHPWLYGVHDDRQGHRRRFTRAALAGEASEYAGLTPVTMRHTNALPLPIYDAMQHLGIEPPESTRGSHGRLLEAIKSAAVGIETRWPLPVGITLMAVFRPNIDSGGSST